MDEHPRALDKKRRAKALEMHLAGFPYRIIMEQCGYKSMSTTYRMVQRAMDELGAPVHVDQVRDAAKVELARLDAMLAGLWTKARKGDPASIDRVLKIEERRTQILMRETAAVKATPGAVKEDGTVVRDFTRRLEERRARQAAT